MCEGVQILRVTKITLPPCPQSPPPVKLSFFDTLFIGLPRIQRLFLYTADIIPMFPSFVESLRSSLSAALQVYLPLAGKLNYVPSTGEVEIDFSDPSVTFIEAESALDLHRLATDEVHDIESLTKLVPAIDISVLPFSVFAVQVTRFNCGGVAIGYFAHHSVADGKAISQFVKAWADACRAKISGVETLIEGRNKSFYDRSVFEHLKGEEIARKFLRSWSPDLPKTSRLLPSPSSAQVSARTFVLDARSVQRLKDQATHDEIGDSVGRPSTFAAISANVWACVVQSKSFDPNEHTFFGFFMDCRARLDPSVDDRYFGNCLRMISGQISTGELTGNDGVAKACTAIRRSIDEVSKDPLRNCENWIAELRAIPLDRLVSASASPRFRLYDVDFGWGRPERVESGSLYQDGMFVLGAGREDGTVQVTVTLHPSNMGTFADLFLNGPNGE